MRYKAGHKERTGARIVDEAARLFRRHGYDGVGIEQIMAAARLTRGGFYAHFRSKEDLFAAVMEREPDFVRRLRARRGATRETLGRQALEVVAGYLALENRERVGRGCPMASLSADVARGGRAWRKAYRAQLEALATELARGLEGADARDPRVLTSIALCVGGLIVARAVDDDGLAADLLEACRDAVTGRLAPAPGPRR